MRTAEERIKCMHERASQIRREERKRRVRIMQAVSMVAGLAAVIVLAFLMPGAISKNAAGTAGGGMYASIFADSSALGIILLCVAAFALGVTVTIFCYRLKEWSNERHEEDK